MWTTDILREEHRWVLRMLDCLERVIALSVQRGQLDSTASVELLSLFAYFADGLHQQREERCLFPRLLTRASSVDERVEIGKLCGDHEQERHLMQGLNENLLGAIYGEPLSLREFAREARAYVELHRQHLAHENLRLLPLAERLLSHEDDESIVQGFRRLESEGPQELRRVFERIQTLSERLGLGAPAAS